MNVWTIHVRSEGDGPPEEVRIRRLLKIALRAFGLRCTGIERNDTAGPLPDAAPTSGLSEVPAAQTGGRSGGEGVWDRRIVAKPAPKPGPKPAILRAAAKLELFSGAAPEIQNFLCHPKTTNRRQPHGGNGAANAMMKVDIKLSSR